MLSMYCYFVWAVDDMNPHAKKLSLISRGQEPVVAIQNYEHWRGISNNPMRFYQILSSTCSASAIIGMGLSEVKNAHAAAFIRNQGSILATTIFPSFGPVAPISAIWARTAS